MQTLRLRPVAPSGQTVSTILEATRAAYARWAPSYRASPHNPLMQAEQEAMLSLWPDVRGRCVLDLAAGSGRYANLARLHGAAEVLAVDACLPMLEQVSDAKRVCASMTALPFRAASFDVILCGLAIAHAADLDGCLREVARVLRGGGRFLYSDFHPAAARQALSRSFKDAQGRTWRVPHQIFEVEQQRQAAARAGLRIEALQELRVGHEFTPAAGGAADFHARWHGLPLVLVARLVK